MEILYNYITDPNTIVSLVVFIFWLWVIYSNVIWKLRELEKRIDKIEDLDLDSRLTEIQTNLKWIMERLKEK
jgi:hypothetical protein